MSRKHVRGDVNYAWHTAEIAVMGPDGAVNIIFKDEIERADDPAAKRAELLNDYVENFASPYVATARRYVDEAIEPRRTRAQLILALYILHNQRPPHPL